eukprot:TRINITY_DN5048_c0_g1_i1.p1 TRINITY_DN5048_c0_g1~~TRINITY_DN5048_c0_g1_i1.p1  ORF type:complete len:267 (-),score=54.62 TRINITY_DN5048_c0_g1_i1:78-878(-)
MEVAKTIFAAGESPARALFQPLAIYYVGFAIFYNLSKIASAAIFPQWYPKLEKRDRVDWDVRVISTVHAIFSVICSSYCILNTSCGQDFTFGVYLPCYWAILVTMAYWMFDLTVMVKHWSALGDVGMVIHHICGIIPFGFGGYFSEMHGYGFWVLLTELSTPFVNFRWYIAVIRKLQDSPTLQKLEVYNGIAMWLAFVVCRIINLPILVYHMFSHLEHTKKGHVAVYGPVISGAIVTLLLSLFWFSKITRGLLKRLLPSKEQRKQR